MKNKKFKLSLFTVLSLSLFLSACGNEDGAASGNTEANEDQVIKLKVADSVPTSNFISTDGIVFFMDRVEELTDGKVEFEYYPAEQLGSAGSLLDLTTSKTTDIGYTTYASEKLPLTDVGTLPGGFSTSKEGTKIFWKLTEEMLLEEEYLKNGVRPLWTVALPSYQLVTGNKKIESIEDIKGLKLRVTGTMELSMQELGAAPVAMAAPEVFTALERGTLDGAVFPVTSYKPYQLEQISDYSTSNANLGSFIVVYSINEEIYQDLPQDVKDAMKTAGQDTMNHFSEFLDENNPKLLEEFSSDMEVYELDQETLDALDAKMGTTWERWAEGLEKRGLPGNKVVEKFNEIKDEQ